MNARRGWGWMPPASAGIWRYGAPWARPFVAAAPWLTLAVLLALFALVGRTFAVSSAIAFDLPHTPVADATAAAAEDVALILPLVRESGGGEETFVFFEEARYALADASSAQALRRALEERTAAGRLKALLVLADHRLSAGDLMKFTALARAAGVGRIEIAERRD